MPLVKSAGPLASTTACTLLEYFASAASELSRVSSMPSSAAICAAGRMPVSPNVLRINIIFRGIRPHPAHRALHIIQLRRPARSIVMKQPVIHWNSHESRQRQKLRQRTHRGFIKAGPSAAVNQHNRGPRLPGVVRRLENIQQQSLAARHAISDVAIHTAWQRTHQQQAQVKSSQTNFAAPATAEPPQRPQTQTRLCASRKIITRRLASRSASDYRCGFRRSTQHFLAVYSLESENLKFFAGVDLDASRSCPVGIACSRKGRFSSGNIGAAGGWCFRWFLVARGCADHRSKLSRSWLP